MKKKLTVLAATVAMAAMMTAAAAGPASADRLDLDEDDLVFFGHPVYSVIDEVDYVNVRERSPRDGECSVEDIDLDGFIAEYELACYY